MVDADGRNLHQISPICLVRGLVPTWRAHRLWVRVLRPRPPGPLGQWVRAYQYFDIYTIRPDGTDLRRLTSDQGSQLASWTTDGRIWFVRRPIVVGPAGTPSRAATALDHGRRWQQRHTTQRLAAAAGCLADRPATTALTRPAS